MIPKNNLGFISPFKSLMHENVLDAIGIVLTYKRTLEAFSSEADVYNTLVYFGGDYPILQTGESPDDYKKRVELWFTSALQMIHSQECSKFSDPEQRFIREELINDPFLRNVVGQRGSVAIDRHSTNQFPPALTRADQRQRTFESIPLCFVIWYTCQFVASNGANRSDLAVFQTGNRPVPTLLNELIKSNRQSNCGNFQITPTSSGLPQNVVSILDLQGTALDPAYLSSPSGLNALYDFFSRLNQYPGNYVPMEPYQHVELQAGNTTTLNSISIESAPDVFTTSTTASYGGPNIVEKGLAPGSTKVKQISLTDGNYPGVIKVLPGNAYGTSINGVHAADSFLLRRHLKDKSGIQVFIGQYSESLIPSSMTTNYALYVVMRAVMQIVNKPPGKGKSSSNDPPKQPNNGKSSPVTSQSKQPSFKQEKGNSPNDLSAFANLILKLLNDNFIKPALAEKLLFKFCVN